MFQMTKTSRGSITFRGEWNVTNVT